MQIQDKRGAHTPGPWTIAPNNFGSVREIIGPKAGLSQRVEDWSPIVAHVHAETPSLMANAKLIAAAPDLVDALQTLEAVLNDEWALPIIRAALAKAGL